MDEEKKRQVISEIIVTVIILVMYWISMQPEWKLQMYLYVIRRRLDPVVSRSQTEHDRIIEKFRTEISAWEAERKRNNAG